MNIFQKEIAKKKIIKYNIIKKKKRDDKENKNIKEEER